MDEYADDRYCRICGRLLSLAHSEMDHDDANRKIEDLTSGFHWRDGWYFRRLDDDSVRVCHEGTEITIPRDEWDSIVLSVTDGRLMASARLEEARLVEENFLDQGGYELVNRRDWEEHLAELERLAGAKE